MTFLIPYFFFIALIALSNIIVEIRILRTGIAALIDGAFTGEIG